jgi:hypothetical protein
LNLQKVQGLRCKSLEFTGLRIYFSKKNAGGPGAWSGGPRLSGGLQVHGRRWLKGSPELVLGAAPVSARSLAVGEKEKGAPGVPTVGEGGRCSAGGKPAMVDQNGDRLELGAMRLEARGGKALGGTWCGEEQRCLKRLL